MSINKLIQEAVQAALNQSEDLRKVKLPEKFNGHLVGFGPSMVAEFQKNAKIKNLAKKVLEGVTDPNNKWFHMLKLDADNPSRNESFFIPVAVSNIGDNGDSEFEANSKVVVEEFFKFVKDYIKDLVEYGMKSDGVKFDYEVWLTNKYGPGPAYDGKTYKEVTPETAMSELSKNNNAVAKIISAVNGFVDEWSNMRITSRRQLKFDFSSMSNSYIQAWFGWVDGFEKFTKTWKEMAEKPEEK